jgi:hypothetical protein
MDLKLKANPLTDESSILPKEEETISAKSVGRENDNSHHENGAALSVDVVRDRYMYSGEKTPSLADRLRSCAQQACRPECSRKSCVDRVLAFLPILSWLPRYDIKNSLFGDVIAGATVAVMHLPQGDQFFAGLINIALLQKLYPFFLSLSLSHTWARVTLYYIAAS